MTLDQWMIAMLMVFIFLLARWGRQTDDRQQKMLRREREKLLLAVEDAGPTPPLRAHVESPAFQEWKAPHEALFEFDVAFPEIKRGL